MTPINDVRLAWGIIDEGMADNCAETVAFGLALLRRCGTAVPTCWLCGGTLAPRSRANLCGGHQAAAERPTRLEEARRVLAGTAAMTDQPQAELLTSNIGDFQETEPECPHTDSLAQRLHLWDIVENEQGERFQVVCRLDGWVLVSEWDGMHWQFSEQDEIRLVRGCVEAPEETPDQALGYSVPNAGDVL